MGQREAGQFGDVIDLDQVVADTDSILKGIY